VTGPDVINFCVEYPPFDAPKDVAATLIGNTLALVDHDHLMFIFLSPHGPYRCVFDRASDPQP
jgi:hypothetical protein